MYLDMEMRFKMFGEAGEVYTEVFGRKFHLYYR